MKLSVQMTRDLDGDFNVAVDALRTCVVARLVESQDEAIRLFEAMVELVEAIEKVTKEDKS